MADHKGSEGHVTIAGGIVANLKDWSCSQSGNTIDSSELTDTWKKIKSGQLSWSGSLSCNWNEADATGQNLLVVGAELAVVFLMEGALGSTLTGSAIVTSIENSAAIDGMVEASFSFEGNGELITALVV